MALQHHSSPTIRAADSTLVHKSSSGARASADLDLVLLPGRRPSRVVSAADTPRVEQIVVPAPVEHEAALDWVAAGGIIRYLHGAGAGGLARARAHADLLDIAPEAAEIELVFASGQLDEVSVDGVVGLPRGAGHTRAAVVRPGAYIHGGARGHTDGAILRAECGDRVVEVVCGAYEVHVRGPEILIAAKVDAGAGGQRGALVGPWSCERGGSRDLDLVAGGEAVVLAVRGALDHSRIVYIAIPGAGAWVRVGVGGAEEGCECEERRENTHDRQMKF